MLNYEIREEENLDLPKKKRRGYRIVMIIDHIPTKLEVASVIMDMVLYKLPKGIKNYIFWIYLNGMDVGGPAYAVYERITEIINHQELCISQPEIIINPYALIGTELEGKNEL
jgi:hypothetical protein